MSERRARLRRLVATVAAAAVTLSLVAVPGTARAHHSTPAELAELKGTLKHVGNFPRFPPASVVTERFGAGVTIPTTALSGNNLVGGVPVVSPGSERIYQLYTLSNNRVGVLVRDLETFAVEGGFLLPTRFKSLVSFGYVTDGARGALPATVDEEGKRVWFWLTGLPESPTGTTPRHGVLTFEEAENLADYTITYKKLGIGQSDVTDIQGNPLGAQVGDPRLIEPEIDRPDAVRGTPVFHGVTYVDGLLYAVLYYNPFFVDHPAPLRLIALDPDNLRVEFDRPVRGCRSPYPEYARNKGSGYMTVLRTDEAVYLPCTSSGNATIVRLPLDSLEDPTGTEQTFVGTGGPFGYLVDQEAGRIHVRVQAPQGPSVITFDTEQLAFVGLQQVGNNPGGEFDAVAWGLDPKTGRIYTQVPPAYKDGLSRIDGRGTPVRPPLTFEAFPKPAHHAGGNIPTMLPRDHVFGRIFALKYQDGVGTATQEFVALEDEPPEPEVVIPRDPDANTRNLVEQPGITRVSFSGEATGYGARQLVVGGVSGLVPNQVTSRPEMNDNVYKRPRCQVADREIIMGRVEDLRLSNGAVSGRSQAAFADDGTRQDLETPSRCTEPGGSNLLGPTINGGVNSLRNAAPWLFDIVEDAVPYNQMLDASGQQWPFETAACTFDKPKNTTRPRKPVNLPPNLDAQEDDVDPLFDEFVASVDCSKPTVVTAAARAGSPTVEAGETLDGTIPGGTPEQASGVEAAPSLSVASASSATAIGFDPKLGLVSRVESLARGVVLTFPGQGSLTIGGIYARTHTSAKGTPKTAKTTYERMLWDVKAVGPDGVAHCELCATEAHMKQFAQGFTSAFGTKVEMRIPDPNPTLRAGTPKGYQAAIQRTDRDLINNTTVNGDSMREVPAVEVLVYNDSVAWGRERQIFQFAGVKANSQYGISCFIGEPQGRRCVAPPEDRGGIAVSLVDGAGKPLAGGTFKAAGAGSCTTASDGGCLIRDVDPGSYTLKQTEAPAGYLPSSETSVFVSPGAVSEASFVNLRNAGVVDVTLADADSKGPLAGGTFELLSDAGGGSPGASVATCVTGADGKCLFSATNEFPLGSYVVVQRGAPEGYEALPDVVPFALEQPGQVASLGFVNGKAGGGAVDVDVKGGGEVFIPTQPIADGLGGDSGSGDVPLGSGGGGFGGLPGAIGNAAKWLTRNPGDAALFLTSLLLFGAPLFASWRRRMLIDAATRNRS